MQKIKTYLEVLPEFFMPRGLIERASALLANSKIIWLKNFLIKRYIKKHKINLARLKNPDINYYPTYNDFFIRKIKKSEMGSPGALEVASPAESIITKFGNIQNETLFQTKKLKFRLENLLNHDEGFVKIFRNGQYFTVFLEPFNYHRYHMPLSGRLTDSVYIPGDSYELDFPTQHVITDLYCKNERYITYFDTEYGKMCLVLIGALFVGGIQPVWLNHPIKSKKLLTYKHNDIILNKCDELGCFKHGSSIILIMEHTHFKWKNYVKTANSIKVCEAIADIQYNRPY